MVAIAATATPSFAFYPVTYFRCTADPLIGHPSNQATSPESRTGYGRRLWAQTAYSYWKFNAGMGANANRYWLANLFLPDVNNAILADIDLYPVYINNNTPNGDLWVGPGPNNTSFWVGNTATAISNLSFGGKDFNGNVVGVDLTAGVVVDALCEAGCYSPEQQVRFGDS